MRYVMIGVLSIISMDVGAASAQSMDTSAQDEEYAICLSEYTRRFGSQYANNYCYEKIFGSDQTGGGKPNEENRPKGGRDCYGGHSDPFCTGVPR